MSNSAAQISLLKHQANYAATNIVKSASSEDELIKILSEHLMHQQEMYKMLETCLSEMHGLIDEVNDQRASRITSTTESEPDYHDQETLHLIQLLLAKARGEQND